jgi:hypothetical protein
MWPAVVPVAKLNSARVTEISSFAGSTATVASPTAPVRRAEDAGRRRRLLGAG